MSSNDDRATDVLDRLEALGLGDGLAEDDLLGKNTREPLRKCCYQIARSIWALLSHNGGAELIPLRTAVVAVQHAANTEQAAAQGRLDESLLHLLQALQDAKSPLKLQRLDVVELLVGALQSAAMDASIHPESREAQEAQDLQIIEESLATLDNEAHELSSALRGIAHACAIDSAHQHRSSAADVSSQLQETVESLMKKLPSGFFNAILPPGSLTPDQETKLTEVDAALRSEYSLRRRMLCERAKVTLQSFSFSKRLTDEGASQAAQTIREQHLARMQPEPQVAVADVFTATLGDVMELTERATSSSGEGSGLHTRVKAVLIGSVPDRGGRTEGRSRVADMPEWTARSVGVGGAGGRGRGGGRGGGGSKRGRKK